MTETGTQISCCEFASLPLFHNSNIAVVYILHDQNLTEKMTVSVTMHLPRICHMDSIS